MTPPLPKIAGVPAWAAGLAVAGAAGAAAAARGEYDGAGCGLLLVVALGLFLAIGSWRSRYLTVAMLAAAWAFAALTLAAAGFELKHWLTWQSRLGRDADELARMIAASERLAEDCRDCPPAGEGSDPAAFAAETRVEREGLLARGREIVLRHRRGFFWALALAEAYAAAAVFLKRWHRAQSTSP